MKLSNVNLKNVTSLFSYLKYIFCIYKMYLIPAEGYEGWSWYVNNKKTSEIWVSMKDVRNSLGLKNMSDPVLEQIYGIYKTKKVT